MRLVVALLLFSPTPILAQTWIAPYHVGQYIHDTIFEFTYIPPDFCGGYSVHLDASAIVPFSQGMTLYLDILQDAWVNGVLHSAGSVFPISDGSDAYDLFFGGSTHLPIQVRAEGTPELEGEIVPCWIDRLHSTNECTDTLTLIWGESFVPCSVEAPTGIAGSISIPYTVVVADNQLIVSPTVAGTIHVSDVSGRIIHSSIMEKNDRQSVDMQTGVAIIRFTGLETVSTMRVFIP